MKTGGLWKIENPHPQPFSLKGRREKGTTHSPEGLGLIKEGLLRKYVFKDGDFKDEQRYSLIRQES